MIAGVDGCKAGWVVVMADEWPIRTPTLVVCRDFATVLAVTQRCVMVTVDIPIGLPPAGQLRECDALAKKILGRRAPCVFFPPPRTLLELTDYAAFNKKHREKFGKGIPKQSFALRPKLLEVDRWMTPERQIRIREFHPELVWYRLAAEVLPSKHKAEGIAARRKILRPIVPCLDDLLASPSHAGRSVKADDVLDALAGLELAHRLTARPLKAGCLPPRSPRDERGLRMEIWF